MAAYLYACQDPATNTWVPVTPAMLGGGGGGASSGTPTDRSSAITTGGTAQQLMAANVLRNGFSVLNLSASDLWINELGVAAAARPSIRLPAGAYYETPAGYGSTGAVSIFGTTAGLSFTAREW